MGISFTCILVLRSCFMPIISRSLSSSSITTTTTTFSTTTTFYPACLTCSFVSTSRISISYCNSGRCLWIVVRNCIPIFIYCPKCPCNFSILVCCYCFLSSISSFIYTMRCYFRPTIKISTTLSSRTLRWLVMHRNLMISRA